MAARHIIFMTYATGSIGNSRPHSPWLFLHLLNMYKYVSEYLSVMEIHMVHDSDIFYRKRTSRHCGIRYNVVTVNNISLYTERSVTIERLFFYRLPWQLYHGQSQRERSLLPPCLGNRVKSAITPEGSGDAKLSQNSFLLEPASVENLHNNRGVRNFWCRMEDGSCFSALGASDARQAKCFTPGEEPVRLPPGLRQGGMEGAESPVRHRPG